MVVDWPLTVADAVMTVEAGVAGVVATAAGVVATGAGVGVLPLEPVEPPQAATSIANKKTMLNGIARLRFFMRVYSFYWISQTRHLPMCFC